MREQEGVFCPWQCLRGDLQEELTKRALPLLDGRDQIWAIQSYLGMKIATFNISNVNKRVADLLDWLRTAEPDVACLQELKATDSEFPVAAIEKAGYGAVWRGQKSWNGVAILARDCEPVVTRMALPGDTADLQSRYIEAAVLRNPN